MSFYRWESNSPSGFLIMIAIPERLKNPFFRFIRLKAKDKIPLDMAWQSHNNYKWDDDVIQKHIASGGNYGVLGGYGSLVIIDCDTPELIGIAESMLPRTFTVTSGSKGKHYYYICADLEKPLRLKDINGSNLGDIQGIGKQVVGAGCIHPNGSEYFVSNECEIAEVRSENIKFAFKDYLCDTSKVERYEQRIKHDLNVTDVIPMGNLKRRGDEYQGAHPVHGSEGGNNFTVNPIKNVWHCFRHDSGGDALKWIAVQEGIINCEDNLRGKNFIKALEVAKEKYGFVEQEPEINVDVLDLTTDKIHDLVKKGLKAEAYHLTANYLIKKHYFRTLRDTEEIYIYDDGIYVRDGNRKIKSEFVKLWGSNGKSYDFNEIKFIIEGMTQTDRSEFNKGINLIPCENGILDIKRGELLDFSPDFTFTFKIPVRYDKNAVCPKIDKFVGEVFKDEDVPTAFEIAGYCLHRRYNIHKAVMLNGEGSNGKSTFISLLKAFLGDENSVSISVQDLETNRFLKGELFNKLANLYADLPDKALQHTGTFKMLTGEDAITCDKKFSNTFTYVNYAKMIFSSNKIPQVDDDTHAFFRRWVILDFPMTFDRDSADKTLIDKLVEPSELSGFLNRSLEGLKRLMERGDFTSSKSVEDSRKMYIFKSDSVKAFVENNVVVDVNAVYPKDKMYSAYVLFCKRIGLVPKANNSFSRELKRHITFDNGRINDCGERVYCYKGIKVVDDDMELEVKQCQL